jgi:hypothetical protein
MKDKNDTASSKVCRGSIVSTSIYLSVHIYIYKQVYNAQKSCLCALLVSLVLLMNRVTLNIGSEQLFFLRQLGLEQLVGVPDRLEHEQAINLLKRDTAGLGDKEESEKEGEEG